MATPTSDLLGRLTTLPTAAFVFATLVVLLLAAAVGQLYLLAGLTELVLGLPLWLWLQLVVVTAMLGVAWLAVRLVAVTREGA